MMKAILYAFLAAVFYAINIPASKVLLRDVGPATMAALLYLGAGIGIAILSLLIANDRKASAPLMRRDMPFVIGMIVLDIAAPIFLMLGIRYGTSANASLLGNFEIVATTVGVMVAGAALVVVDTLVRHHTHPHQHTFTHFHGGYVHTHTITHTHGHDHLGADGKHYHRHPASYLNENLAKHNEKLMLEYVR